jgi:hypothetical protein
VRRFGREAATLVPDAGSNGALRRDIGFGIPGFAGPTCEPETPVCAPTGNDSPTTAGINGPSKDI